MHRLTLALWIMAALALLVLAADMIAHTTPALGTVLFAALASGLAVGIPVHRADNTPTGPCADCGGHAAFGFCIQCGSTKIWAQARSS